MASIQWVCDSCGESDEQMPWDCPGCGNETCEHCFSAFAHCKKCSEGKSDEELRLRANKAGFEFKPDESAASGGDESLSVVARAGQILENRIIEYYARQDSCEKCGGTGWVEPESGDPLIDVPYRCNHRTDVEVCTKNHSHIRT